MQFSTILLLNLLFFELHAEEEHTKVINSEWESKLIYLLRSSCLVAEWWHISSLKLKQNVIQHFKFLSGYAVQYLLLEWHRGWYSQCPLSSTTSPELDYLYSAFSLHDCCRSGPSWNGLCTKCVWISCFFDQWRGLNVISDSLMHINGFQLSLNFCLLLCFDSLFDSFTLWDWT